MNKFKLVSPFKPKGDQPKAIKELVESIDKQKNKYQTLVGVTGSGKTFSISCVIEKLQKPTLVIAHNKTLAAQLYTEFKEFFPENKVEYFVSYYDYYQPESYVAQRDLYIEKNVDINEKLEQLRLSATASISSRKDVIIVASVSCIYGLGNPENFRQLGFELNVGQTISREEILRKLIDIQFERNEMELMPGRFRTKGDTIDIIPGYYQNIIRIELDKGIIERISEIEKVSGKLISKTNSFFVYPARHFVITEDEKKKAVKSIRKELEQRLPQLPELEAHRLKQKTLYDLEMIEEAGYCSGIENYSRHFDGRTVGQRPSCLIDYFPDDFLLVIDESHQTIPQLHAMYAGDYSRKKSLVEYGFRLPSAYDNRPLKFHEFEKEFMNKVVFVSATPGDYEKKHSSKLVEQIIRPTGLVDPIVIVKPIKEQIDDLKLNIYETISKGYRCLVTTITKKLAEELADYLSENGIKTRYLHSEIDTLERTEIIRELRLGKFDCLVGINLLREGLDIPEVAFIGILDADKEGFLRDTKSLIQIIGRAARNSESKVVLYADRQTDSIKNAIAETERRRKIQIEYNTKHNITPKTIIKPVKEKEVEIKDIKHIPKGDIANVIIEIEAEMKTAAENLDFEKAISLRDRILELKKRMEK
ncbi:MAG: excinuclease ABC subunit UvrB [archaeon]